MGAPQTQRARRGGALAATLRRLTDRSTPVSAPEPKESEPVIAEGTLVDRRYRVIHKLGDGGMGTVFKVEHVRMGKLMALKLLQRRFARDRGLIERFEQEAQIASWLSCPNTVSVFDFGEMAEYGLYMAMELVPGRDIGSLLDADGAFSERRAVGIAIQILHSLAEAHDAGIIHRDIKPPNLMLLRTRDAKDFVKVLDFGIAQLVGAADVAEGAFHGTPEYASPEQIRGQSVDARSDLYSLSATLFELVTGDPPFLDENPVEVLSHHLDRPPPSVREAAPNADLSPELEALLLRGLAKSPDDRFQSADDMRAQLEKLGDRFSGKVMAGPFKDLRDLVQVDASIAQRTDWDAFERSLRRSQRWRRVVGITLAACALGGGGAAINSAVRTRAAAPVTESVVDSEHEPNNTPEQANIITPGHTIQGTIGRRLSDLDSDIDAYQFQIPPSGPMRVAIRVSSVPNVNLAVELFRREPGRNGGRGEAVRFRKLVQVDDQPLPSRQPELMDDLRLEPGVYVVQIQDRRRASERDVRRPRENSTDAYELTVALEALDPLAEVEPNDTPEEARRQAGLIDAGRPILGHTGLPAARELVAGVASVRWSDDCYALRLSPGAHTGCALLSGVPQATLSLQVARAGTPATARTVEQGAAPTSGCASASEALDARVELEAGGDPEARYVLVAFDDGPDGFSGVLRAADLLTAAGRKDEARHVLERALAELPKAPDAERARKLLSPRRAGLPKGGGDD